MKKYIVTVPPTKDQGSYRTVASSRADALWDYNSARAHDGLPPLQRMPNGTQYKEVIMRYIQLKGSCGLETVDEFETMKEARAMLKEYRLSDPSGYYYISSRCCKAWKESI